MSIAKRFSFTCQDSTKKIFTVCDVLRLDGGVHFHVILVSGRTGRFFVLVDRHFSPCPNHYFIIITTTTLTITTSVVAALSSLHLGTTFVIINISFNLLVSVWIY
jgi:hypothetical protein